ncbi:MAG: hypothetical protein JNM24_00895 [Bdellovibrionaceae bacterium]|nr:hypothetical protein [Pseudobdellovibrionaceae bacterium]
MLPSESQKQVSVLSDKDNRIIVASDKNEMGRVYRIEDLKHFVAIEKLVITATEVLAAEAEWVSHILSLCLAKGAKILVLFDTYTDDSEKKNFVLFKMLRVQNLKLVMSDYDKLVFEYYGNTILPSIVSKPKKYLIADVMWEVLVKIAPLRIAAKYTYRFILKWKERLT